MGNKNVRSRRLIVLLVTISMLMTMLPLLFLQGLAYTNTTAILEIPYTKTVALGGNAAPGQENFAFEFATPRSGFSLDPYVITTNGAGSHTGNIIIDITRQDVYDYIFTFGFDLWERDDGKAGWEYSKSRWFVKPYYDQSGNIQYTIRQYAGDSMLDDSERVAFTNTYTANTVTLEIPYTKIIALGGNAAPGREEFTFEFVTPRSGFTLDPYVITTNGAGSHTGNIVIDITRQDVYDYIFTFGFDVYERDGGKAGWTYSKTAWYVRPYFGQQQELRYVIREYAGDSMLDDSERVAFTNTYTANLTTSTLTALKTDAEGVPLAGATLRLEGATEAGVPRIHDVVSNASGVATFTAEPGTYTLSEFAAPSGYNPTDDKYTIFIWEGGLVYMDMGPNRNPAPYEPVTFVNRPIPTLNMDDHFAYMQGYPDNTFGPSRNMTRAEAVVMFSRLLNESMDLDKDHRSNHYPDVPATAWYANQVGYMHSLGVLRDYSRDGRFRPNEPVTRAEFATLAAHFDNLALTSTNRFTDVANNHWAVRYINSAAEKGWILGYPDNTFRPEASITRAEVVTLVNRILNRTADEAYVRSNAASLPRSFSDIASTHWAYMAVMEASIAHDFIREGTAERWTAVRSD